MALPLDRNFLATPDTPTLVKNVPDSNEGPSVIRPTCLSHGCQCQQLRRLSHTGRAITSLVVVIPRGQPLLNPLTTSRAPTGEPYHDLTIKVRMLMVRPAAVRARFFVDLFKLGRRVPL